MINEGKSTGSNPVETGKRVKAFLKSKSQTFSKFPTYKQAVIRQVERIGKKVGKKVAKKAPVTPKSKEDLSKWATTDYMKSVVDWQERVGNLLLEYIIKEGNYSANRVIRKLKSAQKKQEHSRFGTDSINYGVDSYRKWRSKKKVKKSIGD